MWMIIIYHSRLRENKRMQVPISIKNATRLIRDIGQVRLYHDDFDKEGEEYVLISTSRYKVQPNLTPVGHCGTVLKETVLTGISQTIQFLKSYTFTDYEDPLRTSAPRVRHLDELLTKDHLVEDVKVTLVGKASIWSNERFSGWSVQFYISEIQDVLGNDLKEPINPSVEYTSTRLNTWSNHNRHVVHCLNELYEEIKTSGTWGWFNIC